jgi:enoyl-CoA hydratase
MSEKLSIDRDDAVVILTMDDGRANALGPDLSAALSLAVAEAASDESVEAIVLAGREGRFSAGFDLDIIGSGDRAAVRSMVDAGGSLVRQLYGCDVPVVAACTGHAVAAGALLLLGCDVRIGPDAPVKIGLNEVAIGMVLPGWALTIASARLSKRHMQRSIMNARLFDGSNAVDAGFLDAAVAPESVLETARAEAKAMASLDRSAYKGTIAAFRGDTLAEMDADLAG